MSGSDTVAFLDKLVTNDLEGLGEGEARFAALLSPQGKVLFEFIAVRTNDEVLLDVARVSLPDLVKRLTLYKLRSPVTIGDQSGEHDVMVVPPDTASPLAVAAYADPRSTALPNRVIVKRGTIAITSDRTAAHDAMRIAARVPELGRDYASGEVVAHEALLDRLGGVSFTKGCYVGQEIVARMEHRGTARKRFVRVTISGGEEAVQMMPPLGSEIRAGDALVGAIGSCSPVDVRDGQRQWRGLALLRLDRLAEFAAKGVPLTVGGLVVLPDAGDVADLMPKAPDPVALD